MNNLEVEKTMKGEKFIPKEYLEGEKPEQQPAETGGIEIEEEIEKLNNKKEERKVSFFRNQRHKIEIVLLSLGITMASLGCEKRPEKIFDKIKERTGQHTVLISKIEQKNGCVTTIMGKS